MPQGRYFYATLKLKLQFLVISDVPDGMAEVQIDSSTFNRERQSINVWNYNIKVVEAISRYHFFFEKKEF